MANSRTKSSRGSRSVKAGSKATTLLEKSGIDLRILNGRGYKKALRSFSAAPVLGTIAGGVGAYFLIRYAVRYYREHPEMLSFIKENFETLEGKLRDLSRDADMESVDARH